MMFENYERTSAFLTEILYQKIVPFDKIMLIVKFKK
ncbi:hypothetical protein U14_04389 [Candidatus Moduliflexus flocculans]|uniref:Uncharacterized protein n=1 Tax=Candidatus Moduliflexus flocculans TaxID=1499966 RepID=A0A0S6W458_9BACT|nr:hypothetical protein U14_04389 [Candidatus Moduliflexus flocculans]